MFSYAKVTPNTIKYVNSTIYAILPKCVVKLMHSISYERQINLSRILFYSDTKPVDFTF